MNFPNPLQILWRAKRFNSFNRVLKDHFHSRVYNIGLRLNFTCPNRDGKIAVGGCDYGNNAGHTPADCRPRTSVTAQLEQCARALTRRHRAVASTWSIDKRGAHHATFKALERRDSWQGKYYPARPAEAPAPLTFDYLQGATP